MSAGVVSKVLCIVSPADVFFLPVSFLYDYDDTMVYVVLFHISIENISVVTTIGQCICLGQL